MSTSKPEIEVGIPTYKSLDAGLQKALALRKIGFDGPIHISVNPAVPATEEQARLAKAIKARVTLHSEEIGLYRNFRFLAFSGTSSHFCWVALDDDPPAHLFDFFSSNKSLLSAELVISSLQFFRISGGQLEEMRPVDPRSTRNVFNYQPAAIFGIWNRSWLMSIFPKAPFDWLDTFLLAATAFRREILVVGGVHRIGMTRHEPHRVNGKFHLPNGWILHSLKLMGTRVPPSVWYQFAVATYQRTRFSLAEIVFYFRKSLTQKKF